MRAKFLQTLSAILILSILLSASAFAEEGMVSADYVNVRSGPGMQYTVIDCLSRGTTVELTDTSNASWYAVRYNGKEGYMASQYLTSQSQQTLSDGSFTVAMTAEEYDAYVASLPAEETPTPSATPSLSPAPSPSVSPSPTPTTSPSPTPDTPLAEEIASSSPSPSPSPSPDIVSSPSPSPTTEPSVTQTDAYSGKICGDYVRFRSGPGLNYTILAMYNKGQTVSVTGISGDWLACEIDGKTGFVYAKYVSGDTSVSKSEGTTVESYTSPSAATSGISDSLTEEPSAVTQTPVTGYVSGNNVRFRKGASLDAEIIRELYYGNSLSILSSSGEWSSVSIDGETGYIYSKYLKEGSYTAVLDSSSSSDSSSGSDSASSSAAAADAVAATGADIVNYAMQYLGYSYKYGGQDPSTGFDCSGLVWYVYKHFGFTLNRVAADQAKNGVFVDASDLQPGDILCFYSGGSIGHSGIYIGDDKFIHAATSKTGVIITQLSGYYTSRGYEARRIIT